MNRELYFLAQVIHGEARGEPWVGKIAVGHVVLNRVGRNTWYGGSIEEVVRKPYQFSSVIGDCFYDWAAVRVSGSARAALDVLAGHTVDPTGGATHFAAMPDPPWLAGMDPQTCLRIGGHWFWRAVGES